MDYHLGALRPRSDSFGPGRTACFSKQELAPPIQSPHVFSKIYLEDTFDAYSADSGGARVPLAYGHHRRSSHRRRVSKTPRCAVSRSGQLSTYLSQPGPSCLQGHCMSSIWSVHTTLPGRGFGSEQVCAHSGKNLQLRAGPPKASQTSVPSQMEGPHVGMLAMFPFLLPIAATTRVFGT